MRNMFGNNMLNMMYTDIMRYRWGKTNNKPNNKVENSGCRKQLPWKWGLSMALVLPD